MCEFNVIQIKWHKQQPTILTVKIVDYQILYGVNELKNQIRVTPIHFFFVRVSEQATTITDTEKKTQKAVKIKK